MTESELKEALKKYQEAKLKEIDEMVDQMEEHEFSPRFQRRIKKLFWSERYFGSRITLGLVMRHDRHYFNQSGSCRPGQRQSIPFPSMGVFFLFWKAGRVRGKQNRPGGHIPHRFGGG